MTLMLDMLADAKYFDMGHPQSFGVYRAWHRNGAKAMEGVPTFRISMEVMDLVNQLKADLPRAVHDGQARWLEFGNNVSRVGMIISDDGSAIVLGMSMNSKHWADMIFDPDGMVVAANDHHIGAMLEDVQLYGGLMKAYDWMMQALSLIQSPKIVEYVPKTYDIPLQRSRAKAGKRPLSDYHEIVIHVTRREREREAAAHAHYERTGCRLHQVRAHFKVVRSHEHPQGVVRKIEAYWRGDASKGAITQRHYRVAV